MLPELQPTMQFLWDNRRAWNERYLVELANDRAKSPADKDAERARVTLCTLRGLFEHLLMYLLPPCWQSCRKICTSSRVAVTCIMCCAVYP